MKFTLFMLFFATMHICSFNLSAQDVDDDKNVEKLPDEYIDAYNRRDVEVQDDIRQENQSVRKTDFFKTGVRLSGGQSRFAKMSSRSLTDKTIPGTDIPVAYTKAIPKTAFSIGYVLEGNEIERGIFMNVDLSMSFIGTGLKDTYTYENSRRKRFNGIDASYINLHIFMGKLVAFNQHTNLAIGIGPYLGLDLKALGFLSAFGGGDYEEEWEGEGYWDTRSSLAKIRAYDPSNDLPTESLNTSDGRFRNFDFGFGGMIAFNYKQIQLNATYTRGLINIIKDRPTGQNEFFRFGMTYFYKIE